MNKKISCVFLDMDGVLVDWLTGIRESNNLPESIYDKFKKDPGTLSHDSVDVVYGGRDALKKIQLERSIEWWINLKLFPWADYLIATVKESFPVAFLSSPGTCPKAAQAKLIWQSTNYPDIPILIGKHKYLAASGTKVLIDDDDWQLSRFDSADGFAIRWPNQFELETESLEITKLRIRAIVARIKEYEKTL